MKFLWDHSGEKIQHFSWDKINQFGFPLAYLISNYTHLEDSWRIQLLEAINLNLEMNENTWFTYPIRYFSTIFEMFVSSDRSFYAFLTNSPSSTRVLSYTFKKTVETRNELWTNWYRINHCRSRFCIVFKFHEDDCEWGESGRGWILGSLIEWYVWLIECVQGNWNVCGVYSFWIFFFNFSENIYTRNDGRLLIERTRGGECWRSWNF